MSSKLRPSPMYPARSLPVNLLPRDMVDVVVSDVVNPAKFFVQMRSEKDKLDALVTDLASFYSNSHDMFQLPSDEARPGVLVVVRWEGSTWCRGRVQDVLTTDSVKVIFLDYGTQSVIRSSSLLRLAAQFLSVPALAHPARLCAVSPLQSGTWTRSCIHRFNNLVLERPLVAQVIRLPEQDVDDSLELILYDTVTNDLPEGVMINQLLSDEGLAVFADQEHCQLDVEDQPLLTDQVLDSLKGQLSQVEVPACMLPELLELREAVLRLDRGEGEVKMVDLVNTAVGLSLRVINHNAQRQDEVDSGLSTGSPLRPSLSSGLGWTDSFRPLVKSEVERELKISMETKTGLTEISFLQVEGQDWLTESDACHLLPDWGGSQVLETLSVPSCCLVGEEDTDFVVLFQWEGVVRLLDMFEPEMGRLVRSVDDLRLSSSGDSLVQLPH